LQSHEATAVSGFHSRTSVVYREARRHCDGVTPTLRANRRPTCDWSLKPQANAMSTRGALEVLRQSSLQLANPDIAARRRRCSEAERRAG
jgi:hypothetical protein